MDRTVPVSLALPVVVVQPPLTGMTTVSEFAVNRVRSKGGGAYTISRASWMLRPIWAVAKHAQLVFFTMKAVARPGRPYIVADSGLGVWGTCVLVAIFRLRRRRHIVHHHVYNYINQPSLAMRSMVRIGGRYTEHVFLSESMRNSFCNEYCPTATSVVENLGIVMSLLSGDTSSTLREASVRRTGCLTLGFLGRITDEKGLGVLEELVAGLPPSAPVLLQIAGPASGIDRKRVEALAEHACVEWLGPVFGESKLDFLKSIDWLLFPTQYDREAQPLVIWEAALGGAQVIAISKGAIPEQAASVGGIVVADRREFVDQVLSLAAGSDEHDDRERDTRIDRVVGRAARELDSFDRLLGVT